MPAVRRVELGWPYEGLATALAFQQQSPRTTPSALNVLLKETIGERYRGGSRPGLKREHDTVFSQQGIQFLCPQRYLDNNLKPAVRLVFAAGGVVYYREGTSEPVACATRLSSTALGLHAVERYNRVYILDAGTVKYVDFSASPPDVFTLTARYGTLPSGAHILTRYRDRLLLIAGNQWYMSRQGDWEDWDYGADADDVRRAVSGETGDVGVIGDEITVAAPLGDLYLVLGTPESLHVMRGDPAAGGYMETVSRTLGCVDSRAWCYAQDDVWLFLSHQGLAALPPEPSARPRVLSLDRVPQQLRQLPRDMLITMVFDSTARGVFIFGAHSSGDMAWFVDWQNVHGYWPLRFPSFCQPVAACNVVYDPTKGPVSVLGCRDGRLRRLDPNHPFDDVDTPIESRVMFGPLLLGGSPHTWGYLREMTGVLAERSGQVRWLVRSGRSAEEAVTARARDAGVWGGGRNSIAWPAVSGTAVAIELESTSQWAMEGISAIVEQYATRGL